MQKSLATTASFLISEDCNLACKYCFELKKRNKNHMTPDVAASGVDFLFKNAIKNVSKGIEESVSVTLFGGEPLLKPDIIHEVVTTGLRLQESTGINFNFSMVTNGTLIDENIVRQFQEYIIKGLHFSIQLSVDSVKELNDLNRVTKGGKGSFQMIEDNLPLFKEIFGGEDYIYGEKRGNLFVHGSLNKKTIKKLHEAYRYFKDVWNVPSLWFMPIHSENWSEEDADIYNNQLYLIAEDIKKELIETKNVIYLSDYAPLNKALNENDLNQNKMGTPCGAGKSYLTITADGSIYPCHQFYFNSARNETLLGSIYTEIDHEKNAIFENYSADDMYCVIDKNCDVYNCYRCIAEYYEQTGSILSTIYDPRCKMSRYERDLIFDLRKFLNSHSDFFHDIPKKIQNDLKIENFFNLINKSGDL